MIPTGWRQEGHPASKTLLHFLFFNMDDNKNGRGTARSTSWATSSTYEKQNDGEPGQTAGRSSRHYEGHRPDALQGSRWADGRILLVFQTASDLQTGTFELSSRSAEIVETLHRRKIDVCCVQETRWTGAGARVMGACQGINSSGRLLKTVMHGLGYLFQTGGSIGLLM